VFGEKGAISHFRLPYLHHFSILYYHARLAKSFYHMPSYALTGHGLFLPIIKCALDGSQVVIVCINGNNKID
jgi:hypothetical protein